MKKLYVTLKSKISKIQQEPKIKGYLSNIFLLFLLSFSSRVFDHIYEDLNESFLETIGSAFILFLILAVVYSLLSPTLWFWVIKKFKNNI